MPSRNARSRTACSPIPTARVEFLFFVSLGERYTEVIADSALHYAAGQDAWEKIVADFTTAAGSGHIAHGFIAGINACGAFLEKHQPKDD